MDLDNEDENRGALRKKGGFLQKALNIKAAEQNMDTGAWATELRQVEEAHQKASYSMFYFGKD